MHRLGSTKLIQFPTSRLSFVLGIVGLSALGSVGCGAESQEAEDTVLAQTATPGGRTDVTTAPTGTTTVTPGGRTDVTTPPTGTTTVTPGGRTDVTTEPTGTTTVTPGGRTDVTDPPTSGPTVTPTPRDNGSSTDRIKLTGDGCPAGSYNAQLSADGLTATIVLTKYATDVDGPRSLSSINCSILFKAPEGNRSYSVAQAAIDGYALLEKGAVGGALMRYWGAGQPEPSWGAARTGAIPSPRDWDWAFVDDVPAAQRSWSRCGGPNEVNISTSLQVGNGTSMDYGYISGETIVIKLEGKACSSGPIVSSTRTEL